MLDRLRNIVPLTPAHSDAERVLETLRQRIVEHTLAPGAPLREQELAAEFGVSRARIRDTFQVLEERGLIERIPHRGAVAIRLEPGQVDELFEVREVLEAQTVRLATEKAPPRTWTTLERRFGNAMERKLAAHDLDAYVEAIDEFRQRCIAEARNGVLSALLAGLYDRTQVLIRRLVLLPGRAQEGMRQHREILAAMRVGDAETAERLKRENIRSARQWFHDYQKYLL